MSAIAPVLRSLVQEAAALSGQFGRAVDVAAMGVLDRRGHLPLRRAGAVSPNGACRFARAKDGWIAVNLARPEDQDLLPAWLGCDFETPPSVALAAHAPRRSRRDLVEGAALLGLPVAAVGEVVAETPDAPLLRLGAGGRRLGPVEVLDLTALWAGPLCGAILAAAGARVRKVESLSRPDPTRAWTPAFFQALNGTKRELRLDVAGEAGRRRLRELALSADVVITSARPRGLASLGLEPAALMARNPRLVWVAITGYGWTGEGASRVAFGDDAAAAGGLVGWTAQGRPRFLGDALSDPLTGLAAANGAMKALTAGGGLLVDAALARTAAGAARRLGMAAA
jgi:crotonobetainyl-CoA:carnitine CoA-transferase CaiB-like acyl-CoA transferase